MKQKFKKILSILVIFTIGITAGYVIFYKPEEAFENKDAPKQIKNEQTLSMMIEQTGGAGDYEMETRTSWPTQEEGYFFNSELSKCENGGELSWDNTKGMVTMTGNMSDKCYVYFDKPIEFYIDDVLFQAGPSMTWEEWLNSSYSDGWSYKTRLTAYSGSDENTCSSNHYYPACVGKTVGDNLLLVSGEALALYTENWSGETGYDNDGCASYSSGCGYTCYVSHPYIMLRNNKIKQQLINVNNYFLKYFPSSVFTPNVEDNNYYIYTFYSVCLTPNTLIDVEEIDEKGKKRRRRKKLKDIKVGDKVICINPVTLELDVDTVVECDGNMNKKHTCYDNWYFDDETVITTVHRHRFYNVENSKFMYMEEWNIGDHGINIDNKKIKLIKHEHIEEEINHCTLFTEKYNNYFANGMLSGNRRSKNMKL